MERKWIRLPGSVSITGDEKVHQGLMIVIYVRKIMKNSPYAVRGFWWN